jgi:AcrR family transcriptional regulator
MTDIAEDVEKDGGDGPSRLELRREARKLAILRAAGAELERVGFSRASLDDIADHVHVTKATLYHYFENKEALFEAWMEHVSGEGNSRLEQALGDSSQSARERLWKLIYTEVLFLVNEYPDYARLFMIVLDWPDSFQGRLRKIREKRDSYFIRVIKEGVEAGEFEVVDKAVARYCMLGGIAYIPTWYNRDGRFGPDKLAEVVADTSLRMFVQGP